MKNNKEFLDKIIGIIEKPYFYELRNYGIVDIYEQEYILRKIYCFDIKVCSNRTIYDSSHKQIYFEESDGYWGTREYDSNGNRIYYENSQGGWIKFKFDSNGNEIFFETEDGYWEKCEYNSNGNRIYYENSIGIVFNNR